MASTVTRTNIDIDDELLERAMALYGTTTKKETVELALRRLIGPPMSKADALAMRGTGWQGGPGALDEGDWESIQWP